MWKSGWLPELQPLFEMDFDELFEGRPVLRRLALFMYYAIIVFTLILMYGRGDFSTPPFVYQEF